MKEDENGLLGRLDLPDWETVEDFRPDDLSEPENEVGYLKIAVNTSDLSDDADEERWLTIKQTELVEDALGEIRVAVDYYSLEGKELSEADNRDLINLQKFSLEKITEQLDILAKLVQKYELFDGGNGQEKSMDVTLLRDSILNSRAEAQFNMAETARAVVKEEVSEWLKSPDDGDKLDMWSFGKYLKNLVHGTGVVFDTEEYLNAELGVVRRIANEVNRAELFRFDNPAVNSVIESERRMIDSLRVILSENKSDDLYPYLSKLVSSYIGEAKDRIDVLENKPRAISSIRKEFILPEGEEIQKYFPTARRVWTSGIADEETGMTYEQAIKLLANDATEMDDSDKEFIIKEDIRSLEDPFDAWEREEFESYDPSRLNLRNENSADADVRYSEIESQKSSGSLLLNLVKLARKQIGIKVEELTPRFRNDINRIKLLGKKLAEELVYSRDGLAGLPELGGMIAKSPKLALDILHGRIERAAKRHQEIIEGNIIAREGTYLSAKAVEDADLVVPNQVLVLETAGESSDEYSKPIQEVGGYTKAEDRNPFGLTEAEMELVVRGHSPKFIIAARFANENSVESWSQEVA